MSCATYASNLASDIKNDLELVGAYTGAADSAKLLEATSLLIAEYSPLKKMGEICKSQREVIEKMRRELLVAQEQRSLKRLTLLMQELKNIDER